MGEDFVNWDKSVYGAALHADNPLTMARHLLTDFKGRIVTGYYAPLSSISLMLDKYVVGSQKPAPKATKLINIFLHVCNGLLIFAVVRLIGGGALLAALTMTVFLLHPVQAQSVLWFAQRKTLLSALFTFASFACYLRARSGAFLYWYVGSVFLFGCGLLAKPAYAAFPLTLLLTELLIPAVGFPPTGRNFTDGRGAREPLQRQFEDGSASAMWPILIRTAPFFALSGLISVIAVFTESPGESSLSLIERALIAASAILFYAQKALLPLRLIPLYPRWQVDPTAIVCGFPLSL